jgi:hypothetical protein
VACGSCGGAKARQTITSADAEAMRQAKEAGDKYLVTAPSGDTLYSGSSYTAAARARRSVSGAAMVSVRSG